MSNSAEQWKLEHGELYIKVDYIKLAQYFKMIKYYTAKIEVMLEQGGLDNETDKIEELLKGGKGETTISER